MPLLAVVVAAAVVVVVVVVVAAAAAAADVATSSVVDPVITNSRTSKIKNNKLAPYGTDGRLLLTANLTVT